MIFWLRYALLPMETLASPTTTPTWVEKRDGSKTLTLSNSSLRLKRTGSGWSLVITVNGGVTAYILPQSKLEDAKTAALDKFKEIVNNLNQDMAQLS